MRSNSHVVIQGRYDIDVFIIDPTDNTILALARHLVYVRPLKMSLGNTNGDEKKKIGLKI